MVADDHAVVRAGICAALNDLPIVQAVAQVQRIKATAPGTRVMLISACPDREFRRRGLEVGRPAG